MTDIIVAPRVEDLTSDTEAVASGAWFRIRPSRAYKAGGQWVHPVWPASVTPLNGTAVTVKLDPIADVPYELELSIPDGNGGSYHPPNEFRYVTASGTPLKWEDLVQSAGPGVGPPLPGTAEARLLALETLYQNLTGGASTLAGITDMTAAARSLNAQSSYANMLATLSAAPLASPALTGNPTAPTPTAGDNDTSIATTAYVQGALSGSGLSFNNAALTGNPTAPTPTAGDNDTSIATTAFVAGALANKADLNGSGLVDASDIDPAIARLADVTAVQATWTNISGRPNVYVPLPCPNSATGVFPSRPSVPPGTVVVWISSAIPPFGGVYMQVGDEWEDRPDV